MLLAFENRHFDEAKMELKQQYNKPMKYNSVTELTSDYFDQQLSKFAWVSTLPFEVAVYNNKIIPLFTIFQVSLTDGPLVGSTNMIGFKLPKNTVYYSSGVLSATVYLLQYDATPLQTGQTKKFDSLKWQSEYSFGVVINQSGI